MASPRWEKVHTVSDYYNGPILGVADVDGMPHVYQKIFSEEQDGYIDRYLVTAIDQELFSLLMEDWAIFLRWRNAFDQGKTTLETHPALPEDLDCYRLLEQAMGDRGMPHPDRSRQVGGHFRRIAPASSHSRCSGWTSR